MKTSTGKRFGPWNSPRVAALSLGAVSVVVLLVLATLISTGSNARTVSANARSLHWVNSALGSAALARAANAQAVVFAVDHDLGVASETAFEAAVNEAEAAVEYLSSVQNLRPPDAAKVDPDLETAVDHFLVIARQVLDDIEQGNIDVAVQQSQQDFEASYRSLDQILTDEQTRILQTIDDTETAIGRVSSIANIVVTLLIPGAAITIYFLFARRQIRERKLAMEYQLEAAHTLARSKDEFIASMSHELRTPLTAIYGFSEVLLSSGALDPRQSTELITIINSESGELMRMVEDILTGARLDAGALTFDMTEVDVNRELEMVVDPFRRAGLDIILAGTAATVLADRMRLRQVLRNLVSNAQKHGGPRIAIGTQIRGTGLVVAVVDNGPGVAPEIEGHLFERFVHDGRRALLTGSVGLGLAIARTLTEAMNGTLKYERIDGHTVFSLTLPLTAVPTPEYSNGRISGSGLMLGQPNIEAGTGAHS